MSSMRKMKTTMVCALLMGLVLVWGDTADARPETKVDALENMALRLQQKFLAGRGPIYEQLLQSSDPAQKALNENPDIELMYVDERGFPRFYITDNLNAAVTLSTDEVWPGGSGGYSLTGSGTTLGKLGIWDGGAVRTTHQEFATGRVTQIDGGSTHYHATHVAGTMVAKGQVAAAKGMSYEANLAAYNWTNDESEMASAAASGMNVSNHSYGYATGWEYSGSWYWYGDLSVSTTEDYMFGFYDGHSRDWDEIAYDAPYYTIVISAGNDNDDDHNSGHYHWDGGWVWATDSHDPDGGTDGYDCLGSPHGAKNPIIVGAVHDIPTGYSDPGDVTLTSFSSWGPTDDGRIKPDVVANGYNLSSCTNTGDSDYLILSGTSMSAPNCSGSLNLLVRHYEATHSSTTPLASTMKAVVIQTADEAGTNTGPDYRHGWGLMNTLHAADVISDDAERPSIIHEDYLPPGSGHVDTLYFYSSGVDPIRVSMAWTDPEGTPPPPSLNPTTLMLVNDLDMRIKHLGSSTTYYPYILDPSNPGNAASTGDNYRDNVEQIYIASPPAGDYIVTISHKSILGSNQWYSLVCSQPMDFIGTDTIDPTVTVTSPNGGEAWYGNSAHDVTWTAVDAGGVDSVSIYYSINNGGSYDLAASGEPNDGVYPWTVPGTATDSALVKVVAYDPSLNQGEDTSDSTFVIIEDITPPVVTVTAPNGGETWYIGDPNDITWEAYDPGFGAPVTDDFTDGDDAGWTHVCWSPTCNWNVTGGVYYLSGSSGPTGSTLDATDSWGDYVFDADVRTDTGSNRTVIFRYVDTDTHYKIVMRPARLILSRHTFASDTTLALATGLSFSSGTWYGIRTVADGADIQVYVDGEKLIDVTDPDPILSGPVGLRAETNEECLFDNVKVTRLVGVEYVDIYYSTDGGSTFPNTIATGETNDWHYEWTVTGPTSSQALVKVVATDQSMNSGEDTSDSDFTIAVFDTTDPDVTVLTPNGGETWYIGNDEDITWTATDANGVDSVSILYSVNDGGSYDLIASGEANDGVYPWTIPATPTDSALVKIIAYDPNLNAGEDVSDARFTIAAPADTTDPAVTVLTPNGGETWYGNDNEDITWTATDANGVDSVTIIYSLDGGGAYHPISSGEDNDGVYTWLVPDTFSVTALVKVIAYDPSLNTGEDESDAVFTIADDTGPIVDVLTPDGGEFVLVWDDYDITWTAKDPSGVDSVSVMYSVNGEDTYELIASQEPDDGTYSWSVPNTVSDSALVKIIAYDGVVNAGEGVSDSLFVIWAGTVDAPGDRRNLGDTVLLWQNAPNPFSPGTNISFYLPEEGTVYLEVFDVKGRLVDVLINGDLRGPGVHTVPWNGKDRDGGRLSSGVYFYRFRTGNVTLVKKMVMTQ